MSFEPNCYVSHDRRFIWIMVAKNASSSIREVLEQPPCNAQITGYAGVDAETRRRYLTFAVVRDPVDRALSAYQEASLRAERLPDYLPDAAFVTMPEGCARFAAFLDEVERSPWDGHVTAQTEILSGIRIDEWGCVETLPEDLARILGPVGVPEMPPLRRHRTRDEVLSDRVGGRDLRRDDLDPQLVSRITEIYADDVELHRSVRDALDSQRAPR